MKIKSINKFILDVFGVGTESKKKQMRANLKAYENIFLKADAGELVLVDLMRFAGMHETSYHHTASANDIVFQEGKRAVVNYILSMAELTEIEFLQKLAASKKVKEK